MPNEDAEDLGTSTAARRAQADRIAAKVASGARWLPASALYEGAEDHVFAAAVSLASSIARRD